MKLYLVATAVWIATVTATLESDSRGNWSNEKNETQGDSQQRHSKQLVQPYLLPVEEKPPEETSPNESEAAPRPARTSQNVPNETVIVEYFPSQEIILQESSTTTKLPGNNENSYNDLGYSIPEEQIDVESVGDFGQRVRAPILRQRSNSFARLKSRQPVANASSPEEHRKHSRKHPRPLVSKKLNVSENTLSTYPEDPVLFSSEPPKALKQKDIEEDNFKNDFHKSNTILSLPWTSEEPSQSSNREQKLRRQQELYNSGSTKDSTASTGIVSLGKFSGPIVVPDLPRQKKYSSTTIDYLGNNELPKSTPSPESTKVKGPDTGYLAASPAILNPLQVGVALMNAGQDLRSLNGDKEFQREAQPSQLAAPNSDGAIQNESTDGGVDPQDQLSQQEQISEVLASNGPTHSVEIQKSVEIYHTAPVHEIHYPMEYVPNNEQPLMKQDYRKSPKGRRPGQVSIYKSNEIIDETVPSSNLDRGRHDYNENDVVHSGGIGQLDQALRPDKLNFGARDQLDSKIAVTQQPSRLVEVLPNLVNVESAQGTQEVPQILVNKPASDPQTDQQLRLLVAAPQPYQVEKMIEKQITIAQPFPVHVPVDRIVEKQIRIPYPVHVEKVIEKKVPIAIQRVLIPFPVHFRVPQPVPIPVEKVVEKPIPVPVPVEKVVEKPVVHVARPYPIDAAKFVKSVAIPIYNVQNDGNYQQLIRQQPFQTLPSYGPANEDQGYYNNSTQLYGLGYALNRPLARQPVVHTLPKKFGSYGSQQYSHSYSIGGNGGNTVTYGRVEKDKILDEYVGPVPRKVPIGIQSKSIQYTSDIQATLRRTRQDGVIGNTGSFRQSKMEYGFKPPMVPSVQYDEQTATKVE
ncbi:uncharacterized protein LOC143358889 isoform X2 [Halictus rubicundus]|uniref:uncharacterized protein LOC143358889 isoform X2 n=1 Tax=Halictus rubicundus TaxID=77578 RepID=UPI004036A67E